MTMPRWKVAKWGMTLRQATVPTSQSGPSARAGWDDALSWARRTEERSR